MAALTHLVGNPDLAKGRLLQRQLDDDRLDLGRRAVRQQRLASRELLKGDFAPSIIQLLEAVEAVARVAHHLAGLADVAELLGKFQQANFGPNDLLLFRPRRCPLERRGRALRTPTTPRPASASPQPMTPSVRLSVNYYSGMDPEAARLIARRSHDATLSGATNGHRLTPQLGIIALLDRRIERIHVDMNDLSKLFKRPTAFGGDPRASAR